jgi:hypothetical protein
MTTIIGPEPRSCQQCGNPFEPRSGSGGSVQRFCSTDCRLSFHRERLRSQRTGSYAGQSPQSATQQPATLLEQAERLIASLPLDQRRRLIERLTTDLLVTIKPVDSVGADDLRGTPEPLSGFEALAGPPWWSTWPRA